MGLIFDVCGKKAFLWLLSELGQAATYEMSPL